MIQDKTSEFKRSRCIFIDLGLVRAAPSITVVQKFLLMAQSAGAPIWFVFVTFGLGHLFGISMRICQCQIQAPACCLTPNSSGRKSERNVCLNHASDGFRVSEGAPLLLEKNWSEIQPGQRESSRTDFGITLRKQEVWKGISTLFHPSQMCSWDAFW